MDLVSGRKMLLADDSITIQKVIDLTFADEGMQVTTVSNGEQAIQKLEEIAPDIVLADVFMPGRNGYEVCEHIKRDERFRHIPVMLLVGSFEPFDEAEARRVGADDFLTKPFQSIRQLVNKVGALLSGREDEGTTRDLKLPAEAARAAANQANAKPTELSMADTAPLHPDMLDTLEPQHEEQDVAGHASFDDQMIESSPASSFKSSAGSSSDVERQLRPTAPLHAEEFEEVKLKVAEQTPSSHLQETIRNFNFEEIDPAPSISKAAPLAPSPAPYMAQAAAADEALLDLGDIEAPRAAAEADDFILDLQDEAPPPSETVAPSADDTGSAMLVDFQEEMIEVAPQAEEFSAAEPEAVEEQQHTGAAYVEEMSPVEEAAPSASESQVSESPDFDPHATLQELQEAPPVSIVEPTQEAGATADAEREEAVETGSATPAGDSQITLSQLSPEVIDAIARRAVEHLSERVVQEIAWEVVPQLAELLIKQRLEEEKKQ
ncbi:MAG: response regulator [Pyrinomonadaceae bacterium]